MANTITEMHKEQTAGRRAVATLCVWLLCTTCADADQKKPGEKHPQEMNINSGDSVDGYHADYQTHKPRCLKESPTDIWIDKVRSTSHTQLCKTVLWVDQLFGDEHQFDDQNFRGKLSLGFRQDEEDGFDPRVRVRIKTKLPNVSNKLNAFIGRVDEDSYVSNTEVDQDSVSNVGLRSNDDEDDEWLIGLGYRNPNKDSNGLDYSIGAKLSGGFSPYARVAHRYLFNYSERQFWRATQTVFWQRDDGFGVSSRLKYNYAANDRNIFEWDNNIKYTEEEDQWEWITSGTLHHSFSKKNGLSSRLYVRGEEENPVSIPEFGLTFTYVQPFLRPWLFIESGVDFRWEKEFADSAYKSQTRFSLQFQMLLGDFYGRQAKTLIKQESAPGKSTLTQVNP